MGGNNLPAGMLEKLSLNYARCGRWRWLYRSARSWHYVPRDGAAHVC